MKAFQLGELGATPSVVELPTPTPVEPGEILVTVVAAGLNPVDTLLSIAANDRGPHPRVLGLEGAVSLNDRAYYIERAVQPNGTLAEWTIAKEADLIALPADLDPTSAVPLGIAGLAGWVPMETTVALQKGETVVVLGATGAVGQAAVKAASYLGAGRIVAVGRNEALLKRLLTRGADAYVVLDGENDAAAIKDATNGGSDVIFDAIYGAPFAAALRSAKDGARTVTVGGMAGGLAPLPSRSLIGKTFHGYSNMTTPSEVKTKAFTTMARLTASGEFVIEHEVVSFDDIELEWQRQVDGPGVKLIVAI
ncbi:MAG: zinc-binding alcohol dehydrogenase family protein [Actinomycetota bacterium]|nr:zinc-binding alcohol dehydrogenase family protein [Actinomycetota bacterium]